ncbi:MAG: hypothetical protein AB7T86_12865 [Xanthobacteraceae bacterium]|uniref:hypothetical protein n=1 Tax=Pseudolabrys sp. TaxID=1960880 RepID=UPI003D0D35B0
MNDVPSTDTARLIARLTGPILAAIGTGLLINNAAYQETALAFLSSPPMIYFSGILAMTAGIAILNVHSRWTRDWRSSVTALGWMLALIGAFRIIAPQFVVYIGAAGFASVRVGFGVLFLALGSFFTLKGYTE